MAEAMIVMTTRNYSELIRLKTFEERYAYLKLGGSVGYSSFGFDRYLNQRFYRSVQWKRIRDEVILRDEGCDLGILDRSIYDKILVHHMNPVSKHELVSENLDLLNPEFLVCVSHGTHNAIHYGDASLLTISPEERRVGDTKLW